MHEFGHNLGWHHSGLPDEGDYDDNSCLMGETYSDFLFRHIPIQITYSFVLLFIQAAVPVRNRCALMQPKVGTLDGIVKLGRKEMKT